MTIAYLAAAHSIHTVRWVNAIARRGHTVHLITMHAMVGHNPIVNSVHIHLLPFPPPAGYLLNVWHLRRLVNNIGPDLLHTHYASGYGTASRLVGFHPTLLSTWGSDVFLFPNEAKWKQNILRHNLAAADYIASTSYAMKSQTEKYVSPKHSIRVTPFGIDCDTFRPFRELKHRDEFIVGTVKSLERAYGIEYLMRAFAIVKKNYQGKQCVKLLIAGDGALKRGLMRVATELGIGDETQLLGFVPHIDVPKVLNRLSAYVAVSVSESFGVAVLEASACGVPVIVSDVGGLPEVVRDRVTGFIVEGNKPEATAKAVMELIEDEELGERMGTAGRKFVLQRYEWNENVSRMEELYRDIIAKWRERR